jgi:hypothetical protein
MANDTDPDNNTLQFISWLTAPAFGALSNLGNGSFRYTPSGSAGVDVLRYNVTDGRLMATGTATITVGEEAKGHIQPLLFAGHYKTLVQLGTSGGSCDMYNLLHCDTLQWRQFV